MDTCKECKHYTMWCEYCSVQGRTAYDDDKACGCFDRKDDIPVMSVKKAIGSRKGEI